MTAILFIFWVSAALILYTYLLFPLIIFLRGWLLRRPIRRDAIRPMVSLVMAVYNEEQDLPARLRNLQQLDYPLDRLEVIIASDGSTDRTNALLQDFHRPNTRALLLPRQGKAKALNSAVALASGELLVFSDANSIYAPDAIQRLIEPFADPQVGGVAGNQVYLDLRKVGLSQAGEKSYWNFDRQLKVAESQSGNVISATGAIYAIRRSLFQPVQEGVTDDFYTSTAVIEQGYRLVFEPRAVSYEPPAASAEREFQRKVRIITRGLRSVIARRGLLNPFRHGFYAVQLFSHKILRRLVVLPLLAIFATSLLLAGSAPFYTAAAGLQTGFYLLALLGFVLQGQMATGRKNRLTTRLLKLASLPFFFTLVNTAALLALVKLLRGSQIARWEPQRAAAEISESENDVALIPVTGAQDAETKPPVSGRQAAP